MIIALITIVTPDRSMSEFIHIRRGVPPIGSCLRINGRCARVLSVIYPPRNVASVVPDESQSVPNVVVGFDYEIIVELEP